MTVHYCDTIPSCEGSTPSSPPVRYVVLYLQVSTTEQARKEGTAEGFSIPAQRDAASKTAHRMGAFVVKEFVDSGRSGTSVNRPGLQRMLEYVEENPVDYVIVHKLDRLARNRADDSGINTRIRQSGVTLVSCSESIDPTPGGQLMHGIMASIAEFYSQNLALEVSKGIIQKLRDGGTPSRAPIGYKNIRAVADDGREYRTVKVDEAKAAMVRWAFHTYAAGDTTLSKITAFVKPPGPQVEHDQREAGARDDGEHGATDAPKPLLQGHHRLARSSLSWQP